MKFYQRDEFLPALLGIAGLSLLVISLISKFL